MLYDSYRYETIDSCQLGFVYTLVHTGYFPRSVLDSVSFACRSVHFILRYVSRIQAEQELGQFGQYTNT
jgi:uncharacterized membrane protein YcgQ (UPF0703/DUF1980 family)